MDPWREIRPLNLPSMCRDAYTMAVVKINNDQKEAKYCYTISMKNSNIPRQSYQLKKQAWYVQEDKESEFKEVVLDPEDHKIKVLLGMDLDQDLEQDLTMFIKKVKSTFS